MSNAEPAVAVPEIFLEATPHIWSHNICTDRSVVSVTRSGSLSTRSPPPVSSDVGMDKHVSSAGSDFQLWDPGIWGVDWVGSDGGLDHPFFLPSLPLNSSWDPNPGLNPFHQSDLRKKHSSIPEKRRHISRSSGNRRRLMKSRLTLQSRAWN